MTKGKKAIGEVECSYKGCVEVCPVFRFEARSDDPQRRRHAGRVYAMCKTHGRIEGQDYILENATIWAVKDTTGATDPAPEPAPKPPEPPKAAPPVKVPVKQVPAPKPAPEETKGKERPFWPIDME